VLKKEATRIKISKFIGGVKMMTLILWEANMSLFPSDPEERKKVIMSMAEEVKRNIDSGKTKMWGISTGGGRGFSIAEGAGKEIFATTAGFTPYIKFKVKPMLSIDEMIEVMKEM
jgi:hypothetical protein